MEHFERTLVGLARAVAVRDVEPAETSTRPHEDEDLAAPAPDDEKMTALPHALPPARG